jgi:uncharacterized protein YciI
MRQKLTKAQREFRRAEREKTNAAIKRWHQKGMFVTFGVLKASEGGMGANDAIEMLRDKGIPAVKSGSAYIGHENVTAYGTKAMRRTAERLINGVF